MNTCNFTLKHYEECMKQLNSSVEVLHDLDTPDDNLIQIAKIEAKYGIKSKFFIRIHAKLYNPFSFENMQVYRELVSLGHELGLHFEPSFYDKKDITETIAAQSTFLSLMLKTEIKYVSIHEPARFGSIDDSLVPSNLKLYCYSSNHYSGKKYISDSGGRWREGCMCEHIGKHNDLIILIHPFWWFHSTSAENY